MKATIRDGLISKATILVSQDLTQEGRLYATLIRGQFQHLKWFCLENDSLQLILVLLTAI